MARLSHGFALWLIMIATLKLMFVLNRRDSAAGSGLAGLWGVASAVSAAAGAAAAAVKQGAGEVVRSVAETDWRSELVALTHEVEAEAQAAVVAAATALPSAVAPRHPAAAVPGKPGAAVNAATTPQQLSGVAESLAQLGKSLLSGTQDALHSMTGMLEGGQAAATDSMQQQRSSHSFSGAAAAATSGAARYNRFEAEVSCARLKLCRVYVRAHARAAAAAVCATGTAGTAAAAAELIDDRL